MKLEDIDDVLKQNVSKDCCVRLLAARILHCDDYSKLYESCRNYDEFEKRVLNKECPLNCWKYSEKGYNNTTYNTISRHVFLPSVEEVSNLVDLNNANKVYNFLKGTNNSVNHMWFRDSNSSSPRHAMNLACDARSVSDSYVTNPWFGVRPAFTVDLSTVSVSVVDSVNYK